MTSELYVRNHPARFWRLLLRPEPSPEEWAAAAADAAHVLPANALKRGTGISDLLDMTLGEAQFGEHSSQIGFGGAIPVARSSVEPVHPALEGAPNGGECPRTWTRPTAWVR